MNTLSNSGTGMFAKTAQVLCLAVLVAGTACVSQKKEYQAEARTNLGQAYMTEKNDEMAIETLRDSAEIDKRNAETWHTLAMVYMRKGAYEESEKAFKKAIRRSDELDAAIHNNYSYLLLNLGRVEEAVEQLEIAREDLTYRKPSIVLNSLGFAYMELEQCEKAVPVLQEAVSRAPNFCQAWFHLGVANRCIDSDGPALDAFDTVILTCPEQAAGAWLQICEVEQERGRLTEAIDACEQMLVLPDLPNDLKNDVNGRIQDMRASAQ